MKKILGIELGSTRIKAVLIDENAKILAQGNHSWENILVDGLWSYSMEKIDEGVKACYADLVKQYGDDIDTVDYIGVSGMMHGYMAFDKDDNLLVPFRTWRNTNTAEAAAELSSVFRFNIPLRWSVAQYYQSVLDRLPHVKDVAFLTTLSGYVHYRLTGQKVLGIDDASGMFPVSGRSYDQDMMEKFNALLRTHGIHTNFEDLLPEVKLAGECAGVLTPAGAKWLDESGKLKPGIPLCPPEGDMGTGMVATCSVTPKTANVSSGTSANFTVVLDKPLQKYYREIDVVATPDGHPTALIHTNNCTSELDKWINLFAQALSLFGAQIDKSELYAKLYTTALSCDENVGGITSYNFIAGEPLAGTVKGAPMVMRTQDGVMNLANFMQAQIYSAIATLALGMDILEKEKVVIESVLAHGGFYKTDFVGQNATSAVLKAPVTVLQTASEGGAWGMALLALYASQPQKDLSEFLADIFENIPKTVVMADGQELRKCENYMQRYRKGLQVQKAASNSNM